MIKYFHELTETEFKELPKMTWAECAEKYPQPVWCSYSDAVCGVMGCWSLMDFMVTGRNYCKDCECYIKKSNERMFSVEPGVEELAEYMEKRCPTCVDCPIIDKCLSKWDRMSTVGIKTYRHLIYLISEFNNLKGGIK